MTQNKFHVPSQKNMEYPKSRGKTQKRRFPKTPQYSQEKHIIYLHSNTKSYLVFFGVNLDETVSFLIKSTTIKKTTSHNKKTPLFRLFFTSAQSQPRPNSVQWVGGSVCCPRRNTSRSLSLSRSKKKRHDQGSLCVALSISTPERSRCVGKNFLSFPCSFPKSYTNNILQLPVSSLPFSLLSTASPSSVSRWLRWLAAA